MFTSIKRIIAGIALGALLAAPGLAQAGSYPDHPVNLVVGYSAGGGSDLTTRLVGHFLSEKWGQPVIVENRAGADGSLAAGYVAKAAPDGYTLIMVTGAHTYPPVGYQLSYDQLNSFAPVSRVVSKGLLVYVNKDLPVKTLQDLIDLAKAKPGELNFGSSGRGTDDFVKTSVFMQRAGIKMTNITYKGGGESMVALLNGEVQVLFGAVAAGAENLKAGMIKALAVTTGQRIAVMPDLPTIAEAGNLPGFDETGWNGLLAPAGTPPEILNKIQQDLVELGKDPAFQKAIGDSGLTLVASKPDDFKAYLAEEIDKYKALYKSLGLIK